MGIHPVPSVLPKSSTEGGRTSIPTSAATRPVAAAVTRQLDAASPRPVTNPGTMGRRCNPHLTCHMARAQAAAVAPLLDAASPHPVTNPGTMGGAAPVPEAPQHSFSDAASTAALLLSCCKYCSSPSLPHGSSRGAELQLLHCSLTQSAPVPLPIQGLWGGAASHCTRRTAGPRAAELSMGALSHGARTVRARCVHGARTVQCFWDGCPTCTPLNGPHRNTPRVLISAPCSPYWHTRILQFLV
jgi:hypothetical protein